MGSVIVITSGKGGTGKTSLTGGIGAALALQGRQVLCIDADVGLRNLDITLGMTDAALMDFSDVMAGRCPLARAVAPHPSVSGLFLLTAPLTLPEDFSGEAGFRALLAEARERYDEILIDSPAGLGAGFRLATCAADRAIVVAVSDPSSLRDAQRVVSQLGRIETAHLVVNRVRPRLLRRQGVTIDDAMDTAGLPLLGLVPEDANVILAASSGQPVAQFTQRGAAQAYSNIARRLLGQTVPLMRTRTAHTPPAHGRGDQRQLSPPLFSGLAPPPFGRRQRYPMRKDEPRMNIALMSHDHKKELMVQFCIAYCGVLSKHTVCATNTTGRLVAEATGLPVRLFLSHAHGGSQQIGARIAYNEIDMVLFFSDPQSSDLDPDLKYINQMCDQYNIPFATNAATAEILIHGLERGDLDWREIINPSLKPVTV